MIYSIFGEIDTGKSIGTISYPVYNPIFPEPVLVTPIVQPRLDNMKRAFCICGHSRKWHTATKCDGQVLVTNIEYDTAEFIQCFCKHFEFKEMRET